MQTSSNGTQSARTLVRGCAGLATAALVGSWLWGVLAHAVAAWAGRQPARADELLAALVAAVALAAVAWLALGVALALLERVPGSLGRAATSVARVVTPRLLRRTAAFVLGVGVVAGLAPGASVAAPTRPALAVTIAPQSEPDAVSSRLPDPAVRPLPDPGWVPAAPAVRPQADVSVLSPAPPSAPSGPEEVVVRRGDTLWGIAARHLGPSASDAQIAAAWPTWFAANRDVVGEDPDRLLPGQVLRAPQVRAS